MSNEKPLVSKVALATGGAVFVFVEVAVGALDAAQALQSQAPTLEDALVVSSTTTNVQSGIFDTRSLAFSLDSMKLSPKPSFTVNTKSS